MSIAHGSMSPFHRITERRYFVGELKMAKRNIMLLLLVGICTASAFGDRILFADSFEYLGEWEPLSGKWVATDGELRQEDVSERIAGISRIVRQEGILVYEFDVRYLSGLEDLYAGFGIHILVDKPTGLRSWGQNQSYLFWLTYDVQAYQTENVFAQVYKSRGPTLMEYYNMRGDEYPIPAEILSVTALPETSKSTVHVKLMIDTTTGNGRLYNPIRPDSYYDINLGSAPGAGMYIALRTNSVALAFDNVSVKKVE